MIKKEKKVIVTTLPITIRRDAQFQTLLSPFICGLLAKFLNAKFIAAVNCSGRWFEDKNEDMINDLVDWYGSCLKTISVQKFSIWQDRDPGYVEYVFGQISQLIRKGIVFQDRSKIYRCECGAIELLENSMAEFYDGKLAVREENKITCRVCKSALKIIEVESLFIRLPDLDIYASSIDVFPFWIRNEAIELSKKFSGVKMRITRIRKNNCAYIKNDQKFYLDTDFVWSFFGSFISFQKDTAQTVVIVTSNRTLRQAIDVIRILRIVEPPNDASFSLLIHPIFEYVSRPGTKNGMTVDDFLQKDAPEVLRYLLTSALSWGNKEIKVESSAMYWIKHSIYPKSVKIETQDKIDKCLKNFLGICNALTAGSLVIKLRKERVLNIFEAGLYNLLK